MNDVDRTRGTRILRYALAALFLFAGAGKLAGLEAMQETFAHFGYSQGFRLLIGALETLGAFGLLVPGLVPWAALGLGAIMVGAVISHLMHDPLYMALPALLVLVALTWVAARHRWPSPLRSTRPHAPPR